MLLAGLFLGCAQGDPVVKVLDEQQTERLLSADTSKVWNLVNRYVDDQLQSISPCEETYQITFRQNSSADLKTATMDDECDPEVIFEGWWRALNLSEAPVTDSLVFLQNPDTVIDGEDEIISHDTTYYTVNQITSIFLTLSRFENVDGVTVTIREDFTVEEE